MVHDSAPPFRAKPMEAEKKETGKEYTCRKEIPYLEQKLEEKGSKKKVQKYSTKNFTSSVQGKKKNIGLSIQRGWGIRIPSILLPITHSQLPQHHYPSYQNPNSTYSRLHALGTYCGWWKASMSWQVLLCTGRPEVIMTGVG